MHRGRPPPDSRSESREGEGAKRLRGCHFFGRMFSSAALGKKLPFHTSSAFTRVLVLNASDTCEAIRDRRPGLAWPKPSARASALLTTVSMASCRRRVSSVLS